MKAYLVGKSWLHSDCFFEATKDCEGLFLGIAIEQVRSVMPNKQCCASCGGKRKVKAKKK